MDDEPTLRLGFAYALSNKGTVVDTANNGRQALERALEKDYDVIIMDVRMPELDGIGTLEALRGHGKMVPVVLCSAALNPQAALLSMRHGVVDFLLKPVRPVDLRQVVEFVVRPDTRLFSKAMVEARNGRLAEALATLRLDPAPEPKHSCWINLFSGILEDESVPSLEQKVRACLPIIAFNSTSPS